MKYINLVLIIFSFFSCKKENSNNFTNGEATAILNTTHWEAETYAASSAAFPKEYIGMSAYVFNKDGYKRESLGFSKVPLETGKFDVGRGGYPHEYSYVGMDYFTILEDGDVVGDIYLLDTLATGNYLEVINYSVDQKEIEIEFSATFLLDRRHHDDAPDTLKFENGYIKTKIKF